MARTLADIEKDKEAVNKKHEAVGVKVQKARDALDAVLSDQKGLDTEWEALDEEWFDVRHADWDDDLLAKAESLNLNLKAYSTEDQLKEAVEGRG